MFDQTQVMLCREDLKKSYRSKSSNHLDFESVLGVKNDLWKRNTMQRAFGPDWLNSGGVGGYPPSLLLSHSPWS